MRRPREDCCSSCHRPGWIFCSPRCATKTPPRRSKSARSSPSHSGCAWCEGSRGNAALDSRADGAARERGASRQAGHHTPARHRVRRGGPPALPRRQSGRLHRLSPHDRGGAAVQPRGARRISRPAVTPAVVHVDVSCLGNGREIATPGGAGGLIELKSGRTVARRDFFVHSPDTTNNKMALAGALGALQLLPRKGSRLTVLLISDSEYLVRGVREWLPGWKARGWKRKGGEIENLALWRALDYSLTLHHTQLSWVRGHNGHPKNEYAT